jgi:RNA polymerase sigma factor (sigma-70 family)
MNSAGQTSSLNLCGIASAPRADWPVAFEELHAIYSRRLYRTIVAITKNPEDAEDALQDTFLRAHLARETFEGRSSIYCWLTRIAINSALMILRKRRVRPELLIDEAIDESAKPLQWEIADQRPNPEQYYIQFENHRRLQSAISKLPITYRRVFEIRQRSDRSIKEIAHETGITAGATKSRLLRARRVLRKSIG